MRFCFSCVIFIALTAFGLIPANADSSSLRPSDQTRLNHQLEAAVANQNKPQISELLRKGANINARNDLGQTLLEVEAERDHLSSVRLLLQYGADPNAGSVYGTPLSQAAASGSVPIVNLLLDHGADANEQNCPLVAALTHAVGAKPEDEMSNVSIIRVQVTPNTASNRRKAQRILRNEEVTLQKSFVKLEMVRVAKLHADGMQVVRILLDRGADVNSHDDFGETPLMASARSGSLQAAMLLVDRDASVNACDKDGGTALMYASAVGAADVVKFLISKGADVNIRDTRHGTALTLASAQSTAVVRSLVEAGADVNAQDQFGYSALGRAALGDNKASVRFLLSRGANPNLKQKDGTTIIQTARLIKDVELLRLLKKAGAK